MPDATRIIHGGDHSLLVEFCRRPREIYDRRSVDQGKVEMWVLQKKAEPEGRLRFARDDFRPNPDRLSLQPVKLRTGGGIGGEGTLGIGHVGPVAGDGIGGLQRGGAVPFDDHILLAP